MTGSATRELWIATPLDWDLHAGSMGHHHAAQYARRGFRVTAFYKVMNRSRAFGALLGDTCLMRTRREERDGVRLVGVDPFFNYFAGLRKNAEEGGGGDAPRKGLRLVRLLAPLAVLRDVFATPCFVWAALRTRGRADVCLGIGAWGSLTGLILRRLGRVRFLVYEDHDYVAGLVPDGLRRRYTRAVERFVLRRADLVVSVGHRLAALRERDVGVRSHVLHNGVDWALYEPARERDSAGQRLVYLGNLVSWSGLEQAVDAVAALAPEYPELRLRVLGSGLPGYESALRARIAERGLADRVELLGRRPAAELPALLGESDIGLANAEPVAFRRFACPLKVVEYMAAGLPVVATRDTEAGDLVEREDCGVAVDHDAGALARALRELLDDPDRRARMRANGIAASRELDWSRQIDRELALLEEAGA